MKKNFKYFLFKKQNSLFLPIFFFLLLIPTSEDFLKNHFSNYSSSSAHANVNDSLIYPNWTGESDQAFARYGCSVSSAGDVNGDGYSDIIVSAAYYDNGQTDEGRAFVYYGSAGGPSSIADWSSESDQQGAYCYSATTAGDVNGDGYSDVIIGAHFYDNDEVDEGRVYVYHGSPNGLSITPDWIAESNQAEAEFGISVSTAGDVNGDGYSDVLIGAQKYDNGEEDEGKAYVFYGSSTGLSSAVNWTAESDQEFSSFGISVATAGDVNGDGFSDVIIGAWLHDNGQIDEGKAYVYQGSPGGLSLVPNWTAECNQTNSYFGYSVSGAGDVNNDGFSDVIIGAFLYDNGQSDEGRAFVYHGSSAGLLNIPSWTAEGDQEGARLGVAVSNGGDFNGDKYSDVVVGVYRHDNVQADEGRINIYNGSVAGLSATVDLHAESNQTNAILGYFVSNGGDVNGDGLFEIIAGAVNYDNGHTDEGAAFIYYGNGNVNLKTLNLTFLIQGFYNNETNNMIRDTAIVYLRYTSSPYAIVDSAKGYLSTTGSAVFLFNNALNGVNYYIQLKHRNSLETWSSQGLSFTNSTLSYNFSSGISQAFGNIMIQVDATPIKYAIYSGDINQDGIVDGADLSEVDNGVYNSVQGYVNTDINGDRFVDGTDLSIVDNNAYNNVITFRP